MAEGLHVLRHFICTTGHKIELFLPRENSDQKSGLAAIGTSMSLPGYHARFSAQVSSFQSVGPSPPLRYVMVADQGVVKTFLSSTVNWSCRYLPRAFATGMP